MLNSGISILIVEDDPRISSLLIEVLSPKFRCATAGSASDAIRLMDSHFFRVAVVDIGLPGMSGLSLCRLIVNRSPRTVVIVVSGNTDEQSVAEAMKVGAFDYITKPFELSQVLAAVERALGRNSPGAVA